MKDANAEHLPRDATRMRLSYFAHTTKSASQERVWSFARVSSVYIVNAMRKEIRGAGFVR